MALPTTANDRTSLLNSSESSKRPRSILFAIGAFALLLSSFAFVSYYRPAETGTSAINASSSGGEQDDSKFPGRKDLIVDLPGLASEITEDMYSGYLSLDNGVHLHYWLLESQSSPNSDPLSLWLNGGPGASSLNGLMSENGPFKVSSDGKSLERNKYSWNRYSNMLYLEAPAGVGFSYNTSGEYNTGDVLQAIDNYEALQVFFYKFPHLRSNEFHITGESYGGIYVPTLALNIVNGNKAGREAINLQSVAIGNGVNEFSGQSIFFFLYYHGLIGLEEWAALKEACPDLQEFKPSKYSDIDLMTDSENSACLDMRKEIFLDVFSQYHMNNYDIYRKCDAEDVALDKTDIRKFISNALNSSHDDISKNHPLALHLKGCLDGSSMDMYINRPEVKKALNVNTDIDWAIAASLAYKLPSGILNFFGIQNMAMIKYAPTLNSSVVDMWRVLLSNNVRVLIYHGDVDAVCDFLGGQWAVHSLKLKRKTRYKPWFMTLDGVKQNVGFYEKFEGGLTFLTVKGAGHMVPEWKPIPAARMFDRIVLGRENGQL